MLFTSTIQGCFPASEISTARARKRTAVSSVVAPCEDNKSAQALISQIDNLNKDNNPLFALGVTASAQVLIDAARSI